MANPCPKLQMEHARSPQPAILHRSYLGMSETGRETRSKKNHGNVLNPTPAPQLSEPRNLGGQHWRKEETSLSIRPLLLSWLAPCLLAK